MPEMIAEAAGTTQNTGAEASTEAAAVAAVTTTQQSATDAANPAPEAPAQKDAATETGTEAARVAPEKYEFVQPETGKAPENIVAALADVAKELNMPQAEAQKVLDKLAPALEAHRTETIRTTHEGWKAELLADPEIGGDKYAETKALAAKTFSDFGTPKLAAVLEGSGLGDHPEFVRWAANVGKAMSEDNRAVRGDGVNNKPVDLEARAAKSLYGNTAN